MAEDRINRRQMLAAAFVALLSPVARRFPPRLVMVSGSASYLAAPLALIPVLLLILFMGRILRGNRSLGDVIELSLGKWLGRLIIFIICIWLIFYCGFILRSAAYRFSSTAYPGAEPWLFIVISAAVCLPPVMGRFSALGRMSVLLRPLLLAVLGAVFIFALSDCNFTGLFALTKDDTLPVIKSGLTVVNTLSVAVYLGFGENYCREDFGAKRWMLWALIILLITELLCLCCLGVFGPELTAKLNYPFFMLARDLSVFNSFARIEALAIALWMFTDAVLISLLLHLSSANLSRCIALERKWLAPAVTVLAAAAALCMPGDMLGVGLFSEKILPLGNAAVIFGLIPAAAAVGWIRGKI